MKTLKQFMESTEHVVCDPKTGKWKGNGSPGADTIAGLRNQHCGSAKPYGVKYVRSLAHHVGYDIDAGPAVRDNGNRVAVKMPNYVKEFKTNKHAADWLEGTLRYHYDMGFLPKKK